MNPVCKWVGGKRKLLPLITEMIQHKPKRIVELFAGGAALTFGIEPKSGWMNDACEPLMNFYEDLKHGPDKLHTQIHKWFQKGTDSDTYYGVRDRFNSNNHRSIRRSAMFYYLNRVGYQGVWRVNQKGEMNVPHGGYVNPSAPLRETLEQAADVLQRVKLTSWDWRQVLKKARATDLVYADPPYLGAFDAYTGKRFDEKDHYDLADALLQCRLKGAQVIISNRMCPEVSNLYPKTKWHGSVIENAQSLTPHNSQGSSELLLVAK